MARMGTSELVAWTIVGICIVSKLSEEAHYAKRPKLVRALDTLGIMAITSVIVVPLSLWLNRLLS